jgi:hypothetical protein
MANGDVGTTLNAPFLPDKTFSVAGTFGAGGSIQLEGDNIDGTKGIILKDTGGNNIVMTAAGTVAIAAVPLFMRPKVTAGDGTTALTPSIVSTKAK